MVFPRISLGSVRLRCATVRRDECVILCAMTDDWKITRWRSGHPVVVVDDACVCFNEWNRQQVDECFDKLPKKYYGVEHRECGGMARSLTHKVQFAHGDAYAIALVSDTLQATDVGQKFEKIRDEYPELRERSLTLKSYLKELSDKHKFSFVVLDDTTKRVFAAATQYSAPLSFGHSKDGMLILFCGSGGTSVATHWPLNEQEVTQCAQQGAAARRRSVDMKERGGGVGTDGRRKSVDGRRSVDGKPTQGAVFTSEVGWVDPGATVPVDFDHNKIILTHLPVGRFVYGHGYLQPYEFTSFWSSAKSNRAGMPERAFHSGNDYIKESPNGSRRSSFDTTREETVSRRSSMDERRHKWEVTDAKCDKASSWRRSATEADASTPLPPRSPIKPPPPEVQASMENLSIDANTDKTEKKTSIGKKIRRNLSMERLKDAFRRGGKK